MSFGCSVADFLGVGQLCWKVYKKCKDSPGNYLDLAREVGALHNVVKETEELLSQQALTSKEKNKLLTCRQGCESVLRDLDGLLVKYESLGTSARRTFDRMGFGLQNMNGIRLRLISNTSLLDAFNNLSSQARLENKMNILIAEVRAGKREGSVISTKTFDATAQIDRDTWEALRGDLEDVGISQDIITEKRQLIITWFQEAVAAGKFEEDPPSDDEDTAFSEPGSDGAVDESGSASIHQTAIACMMIEPSTTEKDTSKITLPNVQRRLKRASDKLDWQSKQLLEAAIAGDVPRVIDSLENGVDIEHKDKERRTALALATNKGNEPVARLLLERGANPELKNTRGDTALIVAAFSGLLSITQLLLENGSDIESSNMYGDTSIIVAARQGHQSIVRLLLEKGADPESSNMYNDTSIIVAARQGYQSVVRLLLEKGANIESVANDGETPLSIAAGAGHESIVQLLLEKGASTERTNVADETPLICAARYGRVSVVQVLLEKGVNVHAKDADGLTALLHATKNETMAQLLRNSGARD